MNKSSSKIRIFLFNTIAIMFSILLFSTVLADDNNERIVVLLNDNLPSTNKTISGAVRQVISEKPDCNFYQFTILKSRVKNKSLIDSIIQYDPAIIFTIGSTPTKFAKDNFKDIPIIFASVKYPVLSGIIKSELNPESNVTGISIDIPIYLQFEKFKQVLPGLKTIGVLYTESTSQLINQAKILAKKMHLNLKALKIENQRELPIKLNKLLSDIDGLWSVADNNLFHPISTRYILLSCLKNNVPIMGFSRHMVESGALFALDFDFYEVGLRAGEIIDRVLDGENPSNIKVTTSDKIIFHFNKNTAKHLGITIPDHLASIAKEVYR